MFSLRDRIDLAKFFREYAIYLAPVFYLAYLVLESYQFDFRAFYLGGKAVIYHLDPYLNHVSELPEFYGPINSEVSPTSGFRYPPFAALVFAPFGLLPYEPAKILFSLLLIGLLGWVCFSLVRQQEFQVPGESILFVTASFPILASFERGQVDLLMLLLTILAFFIHQKYRAFHLPACLLALAGCIKLFPFIVLIFYLFKKEFKFFIYTSIYSVILFVAPIAYLGLPVYVNFFKRFLPEVFGAITRSTPINLHGQSVMNNQVMAVDSKSFTLTHDFTNGFMNPLLQSNSLGALTAGLLTLGFILLISKPLKSDYQFFAVLNTINLFNPLSWIMGLVWYIPLFFHLYHRVSGLGRLIILLPLFMPPFLNTNAILAYLIAVLFAFAFVRPGIGKWLLLSP